MRLLILGGTVFLGRGLVDIARERGHELTLFNRGRSAPDAFADVEQVHGDRDGELSLLTNRSWDAVIDTSGYVPRVVKASAHLLSDRVAHYTFVSSISAYGEFPHRGMNEQAPVAELSETDSEDVDRYYPALKAACEREIHTAYPNGALIVRAGLLVGPHDPTERFTYWVRRLADGGEVLAPSAREQPVQLIDARDLADWIVGMVEDKATASSMPPAQLSRSRSAACSIASRRPLVAPRSSSGSMSNGSPRPGSKRGTSCRSGLI